MKSLLRSSLSILFVPVIAIALSACQFVSPNATVGGSTPTPTPSPALVVISPTPSPVLDLTASPSSTPMASPVDSIEYSCRTGQTPLTALQATNHPVMVQNTSLGKLVTSIGGQAQGNDKYWQYQINGQEAQVGADAYKCQDGDVIVWGIKVKSFLNSQNVMAIALVIIGVLFRWLPHPPNVAPIAAIAIIGSLYLNKKISLFVPLLAMVISDAVIGFYGKEMILVYGCFLLTGLLGLWARQTQSKKRIVAVSLMSSVIFYVITNFGVWLWDSIYAKNLAGLIQCYVMGLPFFRNTILGDLFFTVVLYCLYQVGSRFLLNSTNKKVELTQEHLVT